MKKFLIAISALVIIGCAQTKSTNTDIPIDEGYDSIWRIPLGAEEVNIPLILKKNKVSMCDYFKVKYKEHSSGDYLVACREELESGKWKAYKLNINNGQVEGPLLDSLKLPGY